MFVVTITVTAMLGIFILACYLSYIFYKKNKGSLAQIIVSVSVGIEAFLYLNVKLLHDFSPNKSGLLDRYVISSIFGTILSICYLIGYRQYIKKLSELKKDNDVQN